MRTNSKRFFISIAALASAAAFAPAAWAACGEGAVKTPAVWTSAPTSSPLLERVDYGRNPIVGMWSVQFLAGGNVIDFGYAQWNSDGTEIMNSGGRAPASQNFCMGVWAQTGPASYRLNHFALSYNPTNGVLNARVNIKEDLTLDSGANSFAGTFTIDVYDPTGSTKLQHVAGNILGKRVTVN